jgi:cell division protein FtsB
MTSVPDTLLVKPLPRGRYRRNRWVRRALIFATVVVLVDAVVGKGGVAEGMRAQQEYERAQAELASLRARNAALLERARRLGGDAEAIESLAREQLGVLRPGEVLFVVKRAEEPAAR